MVGNEPATHIEPCAVALIVDTQQSRELLHCLHRHFHPIDGSLGEVLVGRFLCHLVHADGDGAQRSCLAHFLTGSTKPDVFMTCLRQEQPFCLFARQKTDILIYRLLRAPRLHIPQHLPVAEGNCRGYALNLLHVYLSVAPGDKLSCGIADTVDVDGQDADSAGGDGQPWQLYAASLQLDIPLGREILQALVVVDEDESAAVFGAYRPAQEGVIALLDVLLTGELCLHRCQLLAPVVHEEM